MKVLTKRERGMDENSEHFNKEIENTKEEKKEKKPKRSGRAVEYN